MAPAPTQPRPDLFTTVPPQSTKKPGQLTDEQLTQFFDKGFVIVKDLFKPEELQPAIDGVMSLWITCSKLYNAGKIKDKYEKASFNERLILLEKEWKGSPVLLHKRGYLPEGFKHVWSHEKLLNIVEQIIGPDISGHPVWNLRTKKEQKNKMASMTSEANLVGTTVEENDCQYDIGNHIRGSYWTAGLLVNHYFIRLTELKNYPPGPIPLPVIGNLHLLGLKPHESLVQLSKKYGPVMSLSIGPQRIVVFNSIEPAKEALLKKGEEFAGRPQDVISAEIVTHGYNDIAFSDYGPSWKMMRKVAHSSMKMFGAGMEDLEGKVLIEIEELFGRFDAKEGTPFNPYHDMALGVLNIICSIIFGNRYDVNDPEFIDIIQFNRDLVQGFDNSSALAFMPWLKFFPNKGLSQLKRAVKLRDEIMYKKIKEHKETFDASNHRDLTDALWNEFLNEGHVGPAITTIRLTEKNFEMILTDLFVAGSETTTTTLQWSVLYLSKWPEVQKKIAEERENVIGERQPRLVDRGKLHLL
eukprot:gene12087-13333_t